MLHAHGRRIGQSAALVVALAALPATAHAYIDPGSGALLLQVIVSGLLGALFLARKAIRRFLIALGSLVGLRPAGSEDVRPSGGDATPPKD